MSNGKYLAFGRDNLLRPPLADDSTRVSRDDGRRRRQANVYDAVAGSF